MKRDNTLRTIIMVLALMLALSATIHAPAVRAVDGAGMALLKQFPSAVTAAATATVDGGPLVVVATSNAGLYATTAGGTAFRKLSPSLDIMRVTSVAILDAQRWLVGTDGDGLWQTGNAGASFTPVLTLDCSRIASIVPGTAGSGELFVASLCSGLHRSTDGGATWKTIGFGMTGVKVTDVVRLDARRIVIATEDAGLSLSGDNGVSFGKLTCPVSAPVFLAWNTATSSLVAANSTSLATSADGGTHWKALSNPGTVNGIAVLPSGWLVAAIGDKGLVALDSATGTWLSVAGGQQVTSASAMAVQGGWLAAGGTGGQLVRADLGRALAAGTPSLAVGSVPANQTRTVSAVVANIGAGTLAWRIAGTSQYLVATPASGTISGRTAVQVSVDGTQLDQGPYQRLLKMTTDGGDVSVPVSFTVEAEQPIQISLTVGTTTASVAGVTVSLDAAPYIDKASGRTMVPMRFIGEAFGATVMWQAATRRVTVQTSGTANHQPLTMVLTIGSKKATANGKALTLDVAPAIVAGRTFVPLRVISETLGADVAWNGTTRTVGISYLP
jgi:hypothetical protein